MTKTKFALAALALSLSTAAFAADKRSSISVFGNVTIPEEGENTGTVFLSYGYLLTDSIELEGNVGQMFSDGETTGLYGFTGKYYFRAVGAGASVLPYVKAGFLAFVPNVGDTLSGYQAGGGVEFTMGESASTFIEATFNSTKASGIPASNSTQINVGLKLRF